MVWIECPHSANADFDVQEKLALTYQLYLAEKAEFEPENIILNSAAANSSFLLDPKEIARSQGAGYLLLVQVDNYSADFLQVRDYYAGPEGKMVHISVEMETKGRDALISRLSSGAAHCTLRYLYPCDKLKFDAADERVSLQEAYEIETY
jgi:hypothetical protein